VKININQIPAEGLVFEENIAPQALDLDTDIIKFLAPIKVRADITRITNAVTVELDLNAVMSISCSRCLKEFDSGLKKNFRVSYQIDKSQYLIDFNPDIRQEIILDYPLKPLCKPDCKGLCPGCGKDLNQGECGC
jgi:uncharacterized protein